MPPQWRLGLGLIGILIGLGLVYYRLYEWVGGKHDRITVLWVLLAVLLSGVFAVGILSLFGPGLPGVMDPPPWMASPLWFMQ